MGGSLFIMYIIEYKCCIFMCDTFATAITTTSLIIYFFAGGN